jgi:acetoin:2,6-dichlorophenolindophenol oxidoreductase subunit alpha
MSTVSDDKHTRTGPPGIDPALLDRPTGTVDRETSLALYRQMVRMRRFEKRAYDLFMQNLVKGTSHLSLGMEAVAAGFGTAMQPGDCTFATYRGHAHTLARGSSMSAVMAELLGRETGLMHGKGGSMHLTDVDRGVMGSYAIIGAHLTIALGAAWSAQYLGQPGVSVAFFGDGTTNIGAFHEALNFAKVWELPVVFVCENNQYMEYTPIASVTAVSHPAADRASAYGLERVLIDGNDADAVYLTADRVLARARTGGGPALVEAYTYRTTGHSRADPAKYKPEEEVVAWAGYDPLDIYRDRLVRAGVDESVLGATEAEADRDVDEATEAARAASPPGPERLMTNLWADGGSSWRN